MYKSNLPTLALQNPLYILNLYSGIYSNSEFIRIKLMDEFNCRQNSSESGCDNQTKIYIKLKQKITVTKEIINIAQIVDLKTTIRTSVGI